MTVGKNDNSSLDMNVCMCVRTPKRVRASHYNTVTQYKWQLFSSLEVSIEVKYCSIQGLLTAR